VFVWNGLGFVDGDDEMMMHWRLNGMGLDGWDERGKLLFVFAWQVLANLPQRNRDVLTSGVGWTIPGFMKIVNFEHVQPRFPLFHTTPYLYTYLINFNYYLDYLNLPRNVTISYIWKREGEREDEYRESLVLHQLRLSIENRGPNLPSPTPKARSPSTPPRAIEPSTSPRAIYPGCRTWMRCILAKCSGLETDVDEMAVAVVLL
jgi:hypothetical protein